MKIGTIGSGRIVHNILDAVAVTAGMHCEAVYSRTFEKGRELADKYGVKKVYTGLVDLMTDEEVDFIYIASPNSLHYEQAKMALEYGKHVICEKPFTASYETAAELVHLAKEKGLFLFDAVVPSFLPNFYLLKEKLAEVGRIRLVMSNYSQYSSRYKPLLAGEVTNIFSRDFAGGCLQDIGYYNLYFNVAVFGKPVDAVYYPNLYPGQTDTSGVLVLKYPDFVSTNTCAKDTWGVNFAQIEGENGYLYIKGGCNRLTEIQLVTHEGEETLNIQGDEERCNFEMAGIADIVGRRDYEECYRRLDVTLDVVDVLERARKAAGIFFSGE